MGNADVSKTVRLTESEAAVLSRQLSEEVRDRKAKKEKEFKEKGNYPPYVGPTMDDKHYLSYVWDQIALERAASRWYQWTFLVSEKYKNLGARYILQLKLVPCSACNKRDMDGFEIKEPTFNCPCDGSGCPICKRWGMFKCKYCYDFGEIWLTGNGEQIKMSHLPGQVSGGDLAPRLDGKSNKW